MAASSYSSKERDIVDLVKSTPPTRLVLFGKASPVNAPTKVAENNGGEQKKRRKKRKKKWTKPAGKPKRPLSAYNLYFAKERLLMLGKDVPTAEQEALKKKVHCKTHGKISFAVMARTIGAKWKALGSGEKKSFEDRARKEKARYLIELASWKETQKNVASVPGSNVDTVVEDSVSTSGRKIYPIKSGPGATQARLEAAATVPDLNVVESSTAKRILSTDLNAESSSAKRTIPLSQGSNDNDSNLMRLILEQENRHRYYLSLLHQQGNPLIDYSQASQQQHPQIDQSLFHLQGMPRRVSTPVDSFSGSQPLQHLNVDPPLQHLNVDTLSFDRPLLRDLQSFQSPSFQECSSRYHQALDEYSTILRLQQHNRMMGRFNGRNNGL